MVDSSYLQLTAKQQTTNNERKNTLSVIKKNKNREIQQQRLVRNQKSESRDTITPAFSWQHKNTTARSHPARPSPLDPPRAALPESSESTSVLRRDGPVSQPHHSTKVQTTAGHSHHQSSSPDRRPWRWWRWQWRWRITAEGGVRSRARAWRKGGWRLWRGAVGRSTNNTHNRSSGQVLYCYFFLSSLGRSSLHYSHTVAPRLLAGGQLLRLLSLAPSTAHHNVHVVRTAEHMPGRP